MGTMMVVAALLTVPGTSDTERVANRSLAMLSVGAHLGVTSQAVDEGRAQRDAGGELTVTVRLLYIMGLQLSYGPKDIITRGETRLADTSWKASALFYPIDNPFFNTYLRGGVGGSTPAALLRLGRGSAGFHVGTGLEIYIGEHVGIGAELLAMTGSSGTWRAARSSADESSGNSDERSGLGQVWSWLRSISSQRVAATLRYYF